MNCMEEFKYLKLARLEGTWSEQREELGQISPDLLVMKRPQHHLYITQDQIWWIRTRGISQEEPSVLAEAAARWESWLFGAAEDPDTKKRCPTTAAASPRTDVKGTHEHRWKRETLEGSKYILLGPRTGGRCGRQRTPDL